MSIPQSFLLQFWDVSQSLIFGSVGIDPKLPLLVQSVRTDPRITSLIAVGLIHTVVIISLLYYVLPNYSHKSWTNFRTSVLTISKHPQFD